MGLAPYRKAGAAIHHFNPATGEYRPEMKAGMLLQRALIRHVPEEVMKEVVARAPSGARTYKKSTRPPWPEGELRRTGSVAGPIVDIHLAHYKGWTVVVGLDISDDDEDWLGHGKLGLFHTVAAFTSHRTEREFILDGTYMSADAAAAAAYHRIDLIQAGIEDV